MFPSLATALPVFFVLSPPPVAAHMEHWNADDLPRPSQAARAPKWTGDGGKVTTALDVSDDVDLKIDSNDEYTGAFLIKPDLPTDFTICGHYRNKAWIGKYEQTELFQLNGETNRLWAYFQLAGSNMGDPFDSYTRFYGYLGNAFIDVNMDTVWFPLTWLRCCISLASTTGRIVLVVNGQVVEDNIYPAYAEKDEKRPSKLDMVLGLSYDPNGYDSANEFPGHYANINVFSSPLPKDKMISMTEGDSEECAAPGDFLSWADAQDQLLLWSKAKMVTLEETEGPCRRESKMTIFTATFSDHAVCMTHCQKMGSGRVPPVRTLEELDWMKGEMRAITPDTTVLPWFWLPGTDTQEEGVWRDFYTNEPFTDYEYPWYPGHDTRFGSNENCLVYYPPMPEDDEWGEKLCDTPRSWIWGCPCKYKQQPIVRLRGLCGGTKSVIDSSFIFSQTAADPMELYLLGDAKSQIRYNDSSSQWLLTDAKTSVTAVSYSSKVSYVLGKHEWTVSNDVFACNKAEPYKTLLKLSGCIQGEFTCDDGQCVTMEQRCNQIPNCRDASDEVECRLLMLNNNYNMKVPPIVPTGGDSFNKTQVHISIALLKIVSMEEVQHKIDFKFNIILEWKENRVSYYNLKEQTSLNALTDFEIGGLWLPYVIYANTDMQEAVQLMQDLDTTIVVTREGNFRRSAASVVDEIEVFEGKDNRLAMYQTYTKSFQCQYYLQRYPFDTQVRIKENYHILSRISGLLH